jgi:hypothetical protein
MALFGTFSQEMVLSEGCLMGFGGFDGRMLFSFFHSDKQARRLSACNGKDYQAIKPTDITNLLITQRAAGVQKIAYGIC